MEKVIATLEEFNAEARAFAKRLAPRSDTATLVTLSGELGAGKTTFTQQVAAALGVTERVTSPTFVLEKIYPLSGALARLVHIDAYRLEGGKELLPLGFDELMTDPTNLILLEWPEKVADTLPTPSISVQIETLPDGMRRIRYE